MNIFVYFNILILVTDRIKLMNCKSRTAVLYTLCLWIPIAKIMELNLNIWGSRSAKK